MSHEMGRNKGGSLVLKGVAFLTRCEGVKGLRQATFYSGCRYGLHIHHPFPQNLVHSLWQREGGDGFRTVETTNDSGRVCLLNIVTDSAYVQLSNDGTADDVLSTSTVVVCAEVINTAR